MVRDVAPLLGENRRVRRSSEEEQLTLTGWIDDLVQTRQSLDTEPKRGFLDLSAEPLPPAEEDNKKEKMSMNHNVVGGSVMTTLAGPCQ